MNNAILHLQKIWFFCLVLWVLPVFSFPFFFLLPFIPLSQRMKVMQYPYRLGLWIICTFSLIPPPLIIDRRSRPFYLVPTLAVANHCSNWDVLVVQRRVGARAIMKKELLKIPFFGAILRLTGVITVDRQQPSSRASALTQAKKILQNGEGFFYYPEGTRSFNRPRPIDKIHASIIYYAYELNLKVYPVSHVNSELTFKKYPFRYGVLLHDAVFPQDYSSKELFAEAVWSKVLSGREELLTKLAT